MVIKIILVILITILIICTYNKYSPKIDVILSNGNYIIIIWYNTKDNNGNYVRTYNKLLTI